MPISKNNAVYESGEYRYLDEMDDTNANAVAMQAGFGNVDTVVRRMTGVHANYHALVNFQAFKQAIDVVNGITVGVSTTLYDPTMASENSGSPILAAAGIQHMDGRIVSIGLTDLHIN